MYKLETQNINDTDNDFSKFSTKKRIPLTMKIVQNMVKEIKMIQASNLRQKLSNEVFVII